MPFHCRNAKRPNNDCDLLGVHKELFGERRAFVKAATESAASKYFQARGILLDEKAVERGQIDVVNQYSSNIGNGLFIHPIKDRRRH